MKKGILTLTIAATICFALSFTARTASAGSPFLGPCYGYGSPLQGNYYGLYGLGKMFPPPYHAVHPPVYYSQPVPRPYGFSPYALPPGMQPAESLVLVEPEEIMNPYVEEVEAEPAAAENNVTARPQWILNPFAAPIQTDVAALPIVE